MQLFIYLILCSIGTYAFQAQAMDGYGRERKDDQRIQYQPKRSVHWTAYS